MQILYSLLGFILAIGILVTIHEFGHFWVARKVGVKVLRFSVGFGKPLKTWKRKNDDTEYVLAAIPLGGYVKMLDERVEEVSESEKHLAFNQKSILKRAAIVVAGPTANFLFAVVAMWCLYVVGMQDYPTVIGEVRSDSVAAKAGFLANEHIVRVDQQQVYGWQDVQLYLIHRTLKNKSVVFTLKNVLDDSQRQLEVDMSTIDANVVSRGILSSGMGLLPAPLSNEISGVVMGKPAQLSGLHQGDKITQINGKPVKNWNDLVTIISQSPSTKLNIQYLREGQTLQAILVSGSVDIQGELYGQIGVYPTRYQFSTGWFEGFAKAVDYTWRFTAVSLRSLGLMLTRDVSSDNLSGPITIANIAGITVQRGWQDFLSFLAIISISLGLINLLPIPVLDGGHLLFLAIEALKGSPLSERVMLWGQQIGIAFLLLLMSLAFYNDIIRLIS